MRAGPDDLLAATNGRPTVEAWSIGVEPPSLLLRGWLTPSRVTIDVLDVQSGQRSHVQLIVVPSLVVREQDSVHPSGRWEPTHWSMVTTLRNEDVFRALHRFAMQRHLGIERMGQLAQLAGTDAMRRSFAAIKPIRRALRFLSRAAQQLCHQPALQAAQQFFHWPRPRLYRWFCEDTTGRLLQAARCSPGALIYSLALEYGGDEERTAAAAKLRADLVKGRPLNAALDEALQVEWPESRSKLRLLIRRASAGVLVPFFWGELPHTVVPEEIPRDPRANRRWYHLMLCNQRMNDAALVDPRYSELSRFVSKAFAELDASGDVGEQVEDLLAYARETNRFPCRSSSVEKVMGEVERWMAARPPLPPGDEELMPEPGPTAETLLLPLPEAPFPGTTTSELHVDPIRTGAELIAEGEQMDHCVGSFFNTIASGQATIYRVTVGEERLTLAIQRKSGGWRIVQCRGLGNEAASREARAVLTEWVRGQTRKGVGDASTKTLP